MEVKIISSVQNSIQNKIYEINGQMVMLDYDLAELYGIETKVLNQAVKRNKERFPPDFMFQLTKNELDTLRSQIVTSKMDNKKGGRRYLSYAFTEHGVTMLASVLRSPIAIQTNIQIVRAFIALRQIISENSHIIRELEDIRKQIKILQEDIESLFKDNDSYEEHFDDIYIALSELAKRKITDEKTDRPKVGYLK